MRSALVNILDKMPAILASEAFWTAVEAFGTVMALYFIYKQIASARAVTAYEFQREEDNRFRSNEMKLNRSQLARILLQRQNDYRHMEDYADYILDYFEDIGLMLRTKLAPTYFVWTMKCYYVLRYWAVLSNYITWCRKELNDQTYFLEFENLYRAMLKIERKTLRKKKIEFANDELREFLEDKLQVEYRSFEMSDLVVVLQIEQSAFNEVDAYDKPTFERLYREHREGFFVAEVGGKVAGYTIGYVSDGIGEIDSVAVDLLYRNLGIGRKLIELLLKHFTEYGAQSCSLEVRTTNEPAVRLYKKMGFQTGEILPNYYSDGSDAYLMNIDL